MADISELAELALVMTPGSAEEERIVPAVSYLENDTRNRLQECHLNVRACGLGSKQFGLSTSPLELDISK
ncbi:hypothetical protein QJQ45_002455 [Haematococcus lacustris]|nr:hypothetical protein QJQ45_002455 [Haematococcus lacustris]